MSKKSMKTRVGRAGKRVVRKISRELGLEKKPTASTKQAKPTGPVPAPSRAVAPTKSAKPQRLPSQKLLDTEIFDAEYYGYLVSKAFPDKSSAAKHFVQHGMSAGINFHPLFELEYFPNTFRTKYRAKDVQYVLTYLRSPESRNHLWGPLFDARLLRDTSLAGSLLLSKYGPTSSRALPVPKTFLGEPKSVAQVRKQLLAAAKLHTEQKAFHDVNLRETWDAPQEKIWLQQVKRVTTTPGSAPLVSIIMPAWNRATMIGEAISSVLAQTTGDWELIIVDDGSTDTTVSLCQSYAAQDSRIRVFEAEHLGVCAARNRGVLEARGRFIAFLDTDNTWRSHYLETMTGAMVSGNHPSAYAAVRFAHSDDKDRYLGHQVSMESLLVKNSIDLNTYMAERSLIIEAGGFDPQLRRYVDHDLFIRASRLSTPKYMPFIGCDYSHTPAKDRITSSVSSNWEFVVLNKNLLNLARQSAPETVTGRLTVVIVIHQEHRLLAQTVSALREAWEQHDLEILLVDNGSRRNVTTVGVALSQGSDRVRHIQLPRNYGYATAANYGLMEATGEFVYFLHSDVEVRKGWYEPLMRDLQDPSTAAVQSLIADSAGVVQSAGVLIPVEGGLPNDFLAGHPIEDAQKHSGQGLVALRTSAMAVRTADARAIGGFDSLFFNGYEDFDFTMRLAETNAGSLRVASDSVVVRHHHQSPLRYYREKENLDLFRGRWSSALAASSPTHYRQADLELHHVVHQIVEGTLWSRPVAAKRQPVGLTESGTQRLRWAIKICPNFTAAEDAWGDVVFAADLAESLRKLGQDVVIDRVDAFYRETSHLDDVNIVIRGKYPFEPIPGAINLLWVISRPDEIQAKELARYDRVFAASRLWAEHMTTENGVPVEKLLQATNPARFAPGETDPELASDVLFVGGARIPGGRRTVTDSIDAGLDVAVWGPNWKRFVDEDRVRGDYIAPDAAARAYTSAELVLNDHFEDMARWGFVSNRTFDVVSTGARMISDKVDEIEEIFMGAVRTYSSLEELSELSVNRRETFPDDAEMKRIADHVAENHSFDRRAERLLEAALELHGARQLLSNDLER